MASLHQCVSCGDIKRRLSPLNGYKLNSQHDTLTKITSFLDLHREKIDCSNVFMCDPCYKKIIAFDAFQTGARSQAIKVIKLHRSKRLPTTTPEKSLKRHRVADQILTSVEKIKQVITPEKRKTVVDQLVSSVEKLKLRSELDQSKSKSRKSLFNTCDGKEDNTTYESDHLAYTLRRKPENQYTDKQKDPEEVKKIMEKAPNENYSHYILNVKNFMQKMKIPGVSVLSSNTPHDLTNPSLFIEAVQEMILNCEFLYDILSAALGDKISETSKIATIATIYGMLMHSNNNKISAIQRLFTSAAIRYHADNKLLGVLNKVHITLSDNSKSQLLDSFATHSEESLLQTISSGIDGKLNGDNLDIRVDTNDVRMNNKAKDYHFFATDWVADRVSEKLKDLDDRSPVGNINQISYVNFIPTPEENTQFKNYLKVLLARKIVDYMPEFKWMEKVLPDHIPHDLQQEMSTPSKIFMLPILLKNEACYSDCLHILDSYVEDINRIYAKAGRGGELDKLQVPVGGDQLTRVRLEGAKALRKGTHTAVERFDQLNPFIIELFHTLQDFLEKLCKKFLKLNKATDKATLAHLKVVIQRNNVNGKVKVRFKAHEQFVDCVGTAYLLSLVMELFRMQNLHDFPIHDSIPDNVKMLHLGRRSETFNKVMDLVLKKTFIPPLQQDTEDNGQPRPGSLIVQVCAGNMNPCQIESPVNENQVTIKLSIGEEMYHLKASTEQVRNGCTFHLTNKQIPVTVKEVTPPSDELQNYTINFLNWFFISCSMQDAISEGNIYLTNITLKYMMPLFYSHSSLSKYMTECIDYVLKTETLLTPKMALKVRAASFINPTGRLGHNKAADIEKENQVKMLKDLIRGLGANKTENAIVKISKVAPVIHSISDNLCAMTSTRNFHTTHKVRPCDQDVQQILDILKKNNPWQNTPGRHLKAFKYISKSPYSFNRQHFEMCVMNTVDRLKRGIPTTDDRESDDDE